MFSLISDRKSKLKTDQQKEKDKELREENPLQVVEKFRELMKDTQAARVFYKRAELLARQTKEALDKERVPAHKSVLQKQLNFYFKQALYWQQIGAHSRSDVNEMVAKYGISLEKAHRDYVADEVEFFHFQREFATLTQVERAKMNYKPPLLGMEKKVGKNNEETKKLQEIKATAAGILASVPAYSFEHMKQYVPPKGEEDEYLARDQSMLDELAYWTDEEGVRFMAELMQQHFHEHTADQPEEMIQTAEDIVGATKAELNTRARELQATCNTMWARSSTQRIWFERNLRDLISARMRGERVLELPSTIGLINQIAQIERTHPHTTIGVALVGEPGVGKTTLIEYYLKKKGGSGYIQIDMSEEITRAHLLGSPQTQVETRMDFYSRMADTYGGMDEERLKGMVRRSAKELEKGFSSLTPSECEVLAVAQLKEQLERVEHLEVNPQLQALLDAEVSKLSALGTNQEITTDNIQVAALAHLKAAIDSGDTTVEKLLEAKQAELEKTEIDFQADDLELAAKTALKEELEGTYTALHLSDEVKQRLGEVKEAMSKVAWLKYEDEAAKKFAELTVKNGWRDGVVIQALRSNKKLLFDEYNAGKDWKMLHHLFTLRPGEKYQYGDKSGEEIEIPPDWRMYFTGNIKTKHVPGKLKEALVSRIGGQILYVDTPPFVEEWLVVIASISDARGYLTRSEKDIVQLGDLLKKVFDKSRIAMRKKSDIVPLSLRMLANMTEMLMDHETQFARETSVDQAILAEMVRPYLNYPNTVYPVTGPGVDQLPTEIVNYCLGVGLLMTPEVETEVIKWTGMTTAELEKLREGYKDLNWKELLAKQREEMMTALTKMGPVVSAL